MRALIIEDGYSRGALAAARALSRAGWTVGVGSPDASGLAAWSRSTDLRHRIPAPAANAEDFLAAARRAVEQGGFEVVFGAGDPEVLALSLGRDGLGAAVPYPAHERVLQALDKADSIEAARRVGLAAPRSWTEDEFGSLALHGRLVVKPRRQGLGTGGFHPRLAAVLAEGREEALVSAASLRAHGAEPFVQQHVGGALVAYTALVDDDGRVLADAQQVADHVWPAGVGGSVRARTVKVDGTLAEGVNRLLRELGWYGLANVQFIAPARGEPLLIDVNGRFYGSMALAVAAGSNFPALWAALATGRPMPPASQARAGERYHSLAVDLRRASASHPGGLVRDLIGCVAYGRGATHSVWSGKDPLPALLYATRVAGWTVRKAGRSLRPSASPRDRA